MEVNIMSKAIKKERVTNIPVTKTVKDELTD
jgi:hypothetical protein